MSGPSGKQLEGFWYAGRYFGLSRKYLFPIDAPAVDDMDVFNEFIAQIRKGGLYNAPMTLGGKQLRRIVDLGTGSAIWPVQILDRAYAPVEILGVDINMIQPAQIPRGLTTLQFDIEEPSWGPIWSDCDLIHMRMLFGSIQVDRWPRIYRNIFERLKPGLGKIEHAEMEWVPRWDGPPPEYSALRVWSERFRQAVRSFNRDADVDGEKMKEKLAQAGFVDIKLEVERCYVNPGTTGLGRRSDKWFNTWISRSVEGMSLVPMIEGLGDTEEDVRRLCDSVKQDILSLSSRPYFQLYTFVAMRP